jgi:hypothetical protein
LRTLIRARLLVAVLALPVGVLLPPIRRRRGGLGGRWWRLGVSALPGWACGFGGLRSDLLQVGVDLTLVSLAASPAAGHQFMLFYGLVVITEGCQPRRETVRGSGVRRDPDDP